MLKVLEMRNIFELFLFFILLFNSISPSCSFRAISNHFRTSALLHASNDNQVPTFCLNVKIVVKPERREDFLRCIRSNAAGTLANEPLNKAYVWGESTTTKNTFHFHEEFLGEEGFEAHRNAPHFKDWETFTKTDPFIEPPEVIFSR